MGLLNETYDALVAQLVELGLPATHDPRNLRPPAVIVDPPSITDINGQIVRLQFPVVVVAPPPGNLDAVRSALDMADVIIENVNSTLDGEPQIYTIGQTDLPAYRLTVQLTARR
jgi:hypothetical protein